MMKVRISAQPIGWTNDDIHDLGGDIPLERCLAEMKEAGYEGTELGRKFPRDAAELKKVLAPYGLSLASGWHDVLLLKNPYEEEEAKFLKHLDFLQAMGCKVVVVAECGQNLFGPPDARMRRPGQPNGLPETDWKRMVSGFEKLARAAQARGMKAAFHHHMGTVVQDQAETDRLMAETEALHLLIDTGHALYAGADPTALLKKHGRRVAHIHLKDLRKSVLERARSEDWSFEKAVREGLFTVPGDGMFDYGPFFQELDRVGYEGWLVVEAEQDPRKAPPLEYARKGRQYLRRMLEPLGV